MWALHLLWLLTSVISGINQNPVSTVEPQAPQLKKEIDPNLAKPVVAGSTKESLTLEEKIASLKRAVLWDMIWFVGTVTIIMGVMMVLVRQTMTDSMDKAIASLCVFIVYCLILICTIILDKVVD